MTITGRCLCGQISYEVAGDPLTTVICHCEHCQRQSGGAYSVNVVIMEPQITVTGELSTFEDRGEHGDAVYVRRRFCGNCGSPIYSALAEPAGVLALKAGSLDDTSIVEPSRQVWTETKQGWVDLGDLPGTARE